MSDAPRVSLVLLSYARPRQLAEALDAVLAQTLRPAEVLVVDNRSDASQEVARVVGLRPGARLIAPGTNLGYTGGMNLGLSTATGDFVHLTEDDMLLAPDCLERLIEHLRANPTVDLVSGVVLARGTDLITTAGGWIRLEPRFQLEHLGEGCPRQGWTTRPYPVGYATGAMLCARRETWRRLGGFREEYFLYVEDVELCLRARRLGLRIEVVPAALAEHDRPTASSLHDPHLERHKLKNLLSTYLLHASWGACAGLGARLCLYEPVRILLQDGPGAARAAATARVGAAAWVGRRLPRLVHERWTQGRRPDSARG